MEVAIVSLGRDWTAPRDARAQSWRNALGDVGLLGRLPRAASPLLETLTRVQVALKNLEEQEEAHPVAANTLLELPTWVWMVVAGLLLSLILFTEPLIRYLGPEVIPLGLIGAIAVAIYSVLDLRLRRRSQPLLVARHHMTLQMDALLEQDFVIGLAGHTIENTPTLDQLLWMREALQSSDPGCALLGELDAHIEAIQDRIEVLRQRPLLDTDPRLRVDLAAFQDRMDQLG